MCGLIIYREAIRETICKSGLAAHYVLTILLVWETCTTIGQIDYRHGFHTVLVDVSDKGL